MEKGKNKTPKGKRAAPSTVTWKLSGGRRRKSKIPTFDARALLEQIIEDMPFSRDSLEIIYPTPVSDATFDQEPPPHPLLQIFTHYCDTEGRLRRDRISLKQLFAWFSYANLLDGKVLTGTDLALAFNALRVDALSLVQLDKVLTALCKNRNLREYVLRRRLRDAPLSREEWLRQKKAQEALDEWEDSSDEEEDEAEEEGEEEEEAEEEEDEWEHGERTETGSRQHSAPGRWSSYSLASKTGEKSFESEQTPRSSENAPAPPAARRKRTSARKRSGR